MAKIDLTAQRLRELIEYIPETGMFLHRKSRGGVSEGSIAGAILATGYISIGIDGTRYLAHRLAFLYETGAWPTDAIDHINGSRCDNRWLNLRCVSRRVNMQNIRDANLRNISAGLLGVSREPHMVKFRARIRDGTGKMIQIGMFSTAEQAHAAYVEAKRRLHIGCTI